MNNTNLGNVVLDIDDWPFGSGGWDDPFRSSRNHKKCDSENECFVATAVYGNVNAPQVKTLREIRDKILMNNYLGEKFVKFYYSGAGKQTANFINKHLPSTKPAIKKGLDIIVRKYQANKK